MGPASGTTLRSRFQAMSPILMPADGDRDRIAAFEAVFDAYWPRVLAYALRRIANAADAEDIAAETFVVAWRRLAELPGGAATLPWLYAVTRRIVANQPRRNERLTRLRFRLRAESSAPSAATSAESPAALTALGRLRRDDQEILKLLAWEELTHAQIAHVLGLSPNAVAIRVHRARARFADVLRAVNQEEKLEDVKGSGASRTHTQPEGSVTGRDPRENAR